MKTPAETQKALDGFTGALIEAFVPFDRQRVLSFQAGLMALHTKAKKQGEAIDLYAIRDEKTLKAERTRLGITPAEYKDAFAAVTSGRGMPRNVPVAGMVAVTLGEVPRETKNRLMAAQAGVRTWKAANAPVPDDPLAALKATIHDGRDPAKPARFFIGGFGKDPDYLAAAQATNHLADMLTTGVNGRPELKNDPFVKKGLKALNPLSATILRDNAKKMSETPQAGEEIQAAGKDITGRRAGGNRVLHLGLATEKMIRRLEKTGELDGETSRKALSLIEIRREQAARGFSAPRQRVDGLKRTEKLDATLSINGETAGRINESPARREARKTDEKLAEALKKNVGRTGGR